MRRYELVVIFPMEEEPYKTGREVLLADLEKNEVTVEKTEDMGDRQLSYEIKKHKRGRYLFYILNASPEKITVLDRLFKLNVN